MSIYATYWRIQLEAPGGTHFEPNWVTVWAQGVPAHIGSSTLGDYDEDPYGDFLPPPRTDTNEEDETPRAVVFITDDVRGEKDGQEYKDPLLVISGQEYVGTSFPDLLGKLYEALEKRLKLKR